MGTRPYFVTYKGFRRLVEAGSPAVAAQLVVGDDIVELRPARASEVSAWYRDQHPVDVAGAALSGGLYVGGADNAGFSAVFDAEDARDWLIEKLGGGPPENRKAFDAESPAAGAIARFMAIQQVGALGAEDYRVIDGAAPAFGGAIAANAGRASVDIVAELDGGETIDFQDVVTAIGEAKRSELFIDSAGPAPGVAKATGVGRCATHSGSGQK